MADFAKKVEKERERLLAPDEQVLGASTVQPKGTFKRQAIAGGVGGVVGMVVADKMTGGSVAAVPGLANTMPSKRSLAVLTDRRLVMIGLGAMTNSLKDVVVAWPREHVRSVGFVNEGKLVNVLLITFADGSAAEVESVRAGNPSALVAAFAGGVPQPV